MGELKVVEGKVALVTGAGSGIGRAAAEALGRANFHLCLVGRRLPPLLETELLLGAGNCTVFSCDVSQPAAVEELFRKIEEIFGRIDVLFNNAGISLPSVEIDELSVEAWQRCVNVNLTGAFLCARQAYRLMKVQSPRGGRIINNGSISAHMPRPGSAAYTSTKHAITGLTKCISLDGRPYGIACSQIDIGNAGTEMASKFPLGVPQASGDIRPEPIFDVAHCGQAVAFMAGLPLDTNVQFMTIMATTMPYVGRG